MAVATNTQIHTALTRIPSLAHVYYDEIKQQIFSDIEIPEAGYRPGTNWQDRHTTNLSVYLSDAGTEASSSRVEEQLRAIVLSSRRRNKVREALEALRWDGIPRLDDLLINHAGAAATPYTRAVTARTMIAAVARAFQPGCKVDTVLILEGEQGTKKSSLLLELGDIAGPNYTFNNKLRLNDKDTLISVSRHWFVIIDEFASFRKAEVEDLKAFVSNQSDTYRPPYGRNEVSTPRGCIFLATINPTENGYLDDVTGNRRFWPVEVNNIDLDAVREVRMQVWAEAVARYKRGEKWWVDHSETDLLRDMRDQQENRVAEDGWEETVRVYMAWKKKMYPLGMITQEDILEEGLGIEPVRITRGDKIRVGRILTRIRVRPKRSEKSSKRLYDLASHEPTPEDAQKAAGMDFPMKKAPRLG